MTVKVVDLMEDLEQGDRSMEHLKNEDDPGRDPAFQVLWDAVNQIGAGLGQAVLGNPFGGSGLGSLGGLAAQQNLMNQGWQNYQAAQNASTGL